VTEGKTTGRGRALDQISNNPTVLLVIVVLAFVIALISLSSIKIVEMQPGEAWVLQVLPLPYWIGVAVITTAMFLMVKNLRQSRFQILFIASAILLITSFRIAFPVTVTSVPAYEPDATHYITVLSSWVNSGLDFGVQGNYQHNYPLSFIVGFTIIKLGVPLEPFFRWAPFFIYAVIIIMLFLLMQEIVPADKKRSAYSTVPVFLFSFSSLGYWVTVHYCPDLFGAMMYFISLYVAIRFAKTGTWNIRNLFPVLVSIFLLVLSHHLSTLYFIVTLFGFALAVWFFKPEMFRKNPLPFFILGIFTYTLWFVYGTLMYPDFFNVYVYFSGFTSVPQQTAIAGILNNITFAIFPVFIFGLFASQFFSIIGIKNPVILIYNFRKKLNEIRLKVSTDNLLVFAAGFCLVLFLFAVGLGIPALFGSRILEVLLLGMYPLASAKLIELAESNSPKKRAIILVILLVVVLSGIYRYYSQIQRRIII
jgi:hypothetical protein